MTQIFNSLYQFSYRCHVHQIKTINITASAYLKGRTIEEIDPFGSGMEEPSLIVPLEMRCLGRGQNLTVVQINPRSRHFVAYYDKPEFGDTLTTRDPRNLNEICKKAERYAKLVAIRTKEYATEEDHPYDFTVNLFVDVFPYGKKQKILELDNTEIEYAIPADDYVKILAAQRLSNPCL